MEDLCLKNKKMLHFKCDKSGAGFTLIELLVVISIIGILSTVIGVNYTNAKKTTRDVKRKVDMEKCGCSIRDVLF